MARTVIRSFFARDAASGTTVALHTGDLVDQCRIERRQPPDIEDGVYVMSFQSRGRSLRCPLARFQARTELAPSELVEESKPARVAIANDR